MKSMSWFVCLMRRLRCAWTAESYDQRESQPVPCPAKAHDAGLAAD